MSIPTVSRLNRTLLEGVNRPLALFHDALLRDEKIGTMPSIAATMGTTSALVLGSQANRVFSQMINTSDADIYLGFGEAAVFGHGALLVAKGGTYTVDWENLWLGAINGISNGANKIVSTIDGRIA